jgi:hypothetical protein
MTASIISAKKMKNKERPIDRKPTLIMFTSPFYVSLHSPTYLNLLSSHRISIVSCCLIPQFVTLLQFDRSI